MRKSYKITLAIAAVLICAVGVVLAGNPHFVWVKVSQSDNTLDVSGKEAGLGNETQVYIEVTATAACINRGGHNPKADNKTDLAYGENVPVQNGKAYFNFSVTAEFQPECSPPMSVEFSDIEVTDRDHGVSYRY